MTIAPPLRVISICAGIGGFDLGFERAGMETVAVVEKDADCRKLLARRFPRAAQFADLLDVSAAQIPKAEIVAAGTPCQGFSIGGLRGGLADDRSNLCLKFCRLADELDPTVIVWENVPGVLSMRDNAFGCFLAALVGADSALRSPLERGRWTDSGLVVGTKRSAAWRVLDAQYFGVAQRRRRVFLVAGASPDLCAQILFERAGVRGNSAPRQESWEEIAGTLGASLARGGYDDRGDGSGVLPIVSGTLSASFASRGYDDRGDSGGALPIVAGTVSRKWAKGSGGPSGDECQNLTVVAEPLVLSARARGDDGRGYERAEEIRIGAVGALNTVKNDRVLAPVAFKASHYTRDKDGAPSEITPPLSADADRGDQDPIVFQPCISFPANLSGTQCAATEDLAPSLQADNPTAVAGSRVRRLMPIECERLQGFPDGWTDGQSDSARYKQLGNAVNVKVSEWMGVQIVKVLRPAA